tara:strand:+ start:451 stop:1896 length:1446 start_codon:yes stop_codon:yes gene_type:complete
MDTINSIDSLRKFSFKIEGDFIENQNGGFLTFKNDFGLGNAKAFKLFPGLEVITFNLTAKRRITLKNLYKAKNCLHFIFCVEGSLEHQFEDKKKVKIIHRLQNVIVGSKENKSSKISIPENSRAKFSIITIVSIKELSKELSNKSQLSNLLENILSSISRTKEYSYFGEISSATSPFVETLVGTNLSGLSNRLINEAAVFEILSLQYSNRKKDLKNVEQKCTLSKLETFKIIQLSEYISNNLNEDITLKSLTIISGLNQKKIQKGFQFFFNETVNKFIANLRILKAKELLENTDLSISEIVYKIGLNSRSYFSKIFYKKYGLTPKDYKKYHHLSNPTFQLSYSSQVSEGIQQKDLENILNIAKEKNKKLDITGCLIYHNNFFFQILEGPKTEILKLIETIKNDSRNFNLTVLFEGVKSGRTFKEWNMSLIKGDFTNLEINKKFEILPMDFLALTDVKNPIANKYMWEKARNFLIVNQEIDL